MIVRDATFEDYNGLLALGARMIAESKTRFPEIEPDRVRKQLELTLEHPNLMLCGVAEHEGLLIGMVTAFAGDYAFSTELRSACDLLFVTQDRRGLVAAKMLIDFYKDWSDDLGCRVSTMGISTSVHPERTGLLFERCGFYPVGPTFRRDV